MSRITVISISYNHEQYLDTWFKGLVDQDTEMRVVMLNDYSDDGSHDKACSFDWENTKIKERCIAEHAKNEGGPSTFTNAIYLALNTTLNKPDYIALCETDDYWKPGKIKKSIEFLESNGYDAVCTETSAILPDGRFIEKAWENIGVSVPKTIGFGDIIGANRVWTSTFVAKREIFEKSPSPLTFSKYFGPMGDYPLMLWLTYNGYKLGYLNEALSVYREGVGVSAMKREDMVINDNKVRMWAMYGCHELK